jgi:NAD(P)-dependent dehydrogenase (short-subunit alcohol dehydrogenase family)
VNARPPTPERSLALVTGAATGIGRATAEAFLDAGHACMLVDNDSAALAEARRTLGVAHGERVVTVAMNLLHEDAAALAGSLRPFEGYSIHLVNNLGGSAGPRRPLESLTWADFESALRFNLKATVEVTRAVLPAMRARRQGWIVNVGSIAGRAPLDYVGADYATAKAALLGLTRAMARELVSLGVLVNAVCPGIIATERIQKRWSDRPEADNAAILGTIPLGRLGTPAEVARASVFLASRANSYITGAVLDINGGAFIQ